MTNPGTIDFVHLGIGRAIRNDNHRVPLNQREYSWKSEHVLDLFQDWSNAVTKGAYFLGTIVLTRDTEGRLEVADGQQRLATTTILLAAIRDYFHKAKDDLSVRAITDQFLMTIDLEARQYVPKLTLNVDDNQFFYERILLPPNDPQRHAAKPRRQSHRRIEKAAKLAADHVRDITKPLAEKDRAATLLHWKGFIEDRAQVIMLVVPDQLNAFRMFETLNDRGLKTSQADLLKNYLLGEAGDRLQEAQHCWAGMSTTLESLGEDDLTITFLRHLLTAKHGATREREVYDKIKREVSGQFPAMSFLGELSDYAMNYSAILNPSHSHWNEYGAFSTRIRRHIMTLNELRVTQVRPLILACMKTLSHRDLEAVVRQCIRWAVRFLVAGGPTGVVEKHYAGRAVDVWRGDITTAAELDAAMRKHVPRDTDFQEAFSRIQIRKSHIARYLLRSLEQQMKEDPNPDWVVNDDQQIINLEHVLPQQPSQSWSGISEDDADSNYRRIGNLVLLRAGTNSILGNAGFEEKRSAYQESSTYITTQMVLDYDNWGLTEIADRQARLAKEAVKVWPLAMEQS